MQIPDVNVLINAWRAESESHERARRWLERAVAAPTPLGLSDLVTSGALRILTRDVPGLRADLHTTLLRVGELRSAPGVRIVWPGAQHWTIFTDLCRQTGATGNLVPDCYVAALAIEKKATFVSQDRFFARVPGLEWTDLPAI